MSLDTDRLLNNARTHLPGATDTTLKLELFNVLNEFFQDSSVWQEDIDFDVDPADDTRTYYIEAESVASINRLLKLVDSNDFTVEATMAEPGTIILNADPSTAGTFTATVALTINDPVARDGYPEYPQWILNKYGMAFLDGIVGRMMAQPAKPYSNAQLGAFHYRKFRAAVAQASTDSVRKNLANAQAWRFPRFGR